MNLRVMWLLATLVSSSVNASMITWELDIGERVSAPSTDFSSGTKLTITFDTTIDQTISHSIYSLSLWQINNAEFTVDGEVYSALSTSSSSGIGLSRWEAEYFGSQADTVGAYELLTMGITFENDYTLYWELASFLGLGNTPILYGADTSLLTAPFGAIIPGEYWKNNVHFVIPNDPDRSGRVLSWNAYSVPEPSTLYLIISVVFLWLVFASGSLKILVLQKIQK